MKVLVIGVSGMLGHKIFIDLKRNKSLQVFGLCRNLEAIGNFSKDDLNDVQDDFSVDKIDDLDKYIDSLRPKFIINCVGVIKQSKSINKHSETIKINSLFPHELARIASKYNSKLIHFSTDCVFSGKKGMYEETDLEDAIDLYGRSKLLGEVNYDEHLTLRTSMIGHELNNKSSLLEWFLKQKGRSVDGFSKATFSGLPTISISRIINQIIENHEDLQGLYHLSAEPINKFTLLNLIQKIYSLDIKVNRETEFFIDRSLNPSKFYNDTGILVPSWDELILAMYEDYNRENIYAE